MHRHIHEVQSEERMRRKAERKAEMEAILEERERVVMEGKAKKHHSAGVVNEATE